MIYERVVEYIRRNGLSVREFERMCSLSNGTVRKWKDDESVPSVATIGKIAEATHIPPSRWLD